MPKPRQPNAAAFDVDKDIAKFVAHRLSQHKIDVIQPDRVQEWLDKHDDWDKPDEIGEATGAAIKMILGYCRRTETTATSAVAPVAEPSLQK